MIRINSPITRSDCINPPAGLDAVLHLAVGEYVYRYHGPHATIGGYTAVMVDGLIPWFYVPDRALAALDSPVAA